ncbi:MAG: hypothetical protein CVU71_03695 [Deltaproteobacteria bacterium HGW-Deltaproteobacteria-6]|jgi:hypothetical protein|nr:MAG: hypothetical protein CVU71_03695 [Deltaproteobacteria bacterium HGW-Deltaproteobacteria-6]
MKKFSITAILILLFAAIAFAASDTTYQALVHMSGPDEQTVESGGKITVLSGGIVDIESGGYLKIAGTQITPTAAQFNFLSGVTAGTSAASKAVVLGSDSKINAIDITALTLNGTAVTSTAAEINKLASIGAGDVLTTTNTKTLTNKTLSGPIFTIAATHAFALAEDWVLSAAEMLCSLLVTSSGSGDANIIESGGVAGRIRIVRNGGSGTVTIKESGRTGVAIASGKTAVVIHNGTDYIRVTADATH